MAMSKAEAGGGDHLPYLPPGFRFHPTDEEIITHYLTKKVIDSGFTAAAVGEADLNKCEPWDLPNKAKMGEKEWYFFVQKDRKYPTGTRTNRATVSGYWKATGKDKEIYRGKNYLVGMKKTLVFYLGRAPKGEKTNWIMHEFRLEGKVPLYNIHQVAKDEWAVCRVFHKSSSENKNPNPVHEMPRSSHTEHEISTNSLPPLIEPSYSAGPAGSSFTDGESEFKAGIIDHMASSTLNNTMSQNPNNIPTGINNYLTAGGYQMNPSLIPNPNMAQPVFNPNVQADTSVFQPNGPANPSYYYNQNQNQLGSSNIAQCKVEPDQPMPMIEPDTGFSTNLNPTGSFKPEPLSGSSSMPEFEDLIGQFINNTDSDTGFGFSWDF